MGKETRKRPSQLTEKAFYVLRTGIELSYEISLHRNLLLRRFDASGAAGLNAFEHPGHVAAELAHYLHAFFVLYDLFRGASVYHVPVF